MNIAYCIIAHKNNSILSECIRILSKKNDIYLHVDKKTNINDFKEYKNKVNFINNRVDVRWGSYSQVQATLNLLESTKCKNYDYIFLLSGDCLPLKSNVEIEKILKLNNKREYVALDIYFKKVEDRVMYNYTKYHYKKNKNIYEKIIIKIYTLLKSILFRNKLYDKLPKLYKGTQWFGITSELRDYILEYVNNNELYVKSFKKSYCSDEVFFHTIIYNSKFKEKIYQPIQTNNICYQALRYIDWKSGPDYPRILNENDFDKMKNTECIFARKFNENLDLELYRKKFGIDKNN